MKILLIGNGAREHIIGEKFVNSCTKPKLYIFGDKKNPGLAKLATQYQLGSLTDFKALEQFAKKIKPDFAFIGPDNPIADGAADLLEKLHIPSIAPKKALACIESSKSFTRALLNEYKIPGNPQLKIFYLNCDKKCNIATTFCSNKLSDHKKAITQFIKKLNNNYVVKFDGLKGGKGVKVSGDHLITPKEGIAYAMECLKQANQVVIEEKLIGQEFSLMCFTDGKTVIPMPAIQDFKRAFDNDKGPNTGGMGSYSDANHYLPFLKKQEYDKAVDICRQVVNALRKKCGEPYRGIIYGGFIITANDIKLIEFNARFGDPEAMNALSILKTDLVKICQAIIAGTLNKLKIEFAKKATVVKYAVPQGYPDNPAKGKEIKLEKISKKCRTYFASVDAQGKKILLSTSRAVAFVGIGKTIMEAEKIAENNVVNVVGPVFHRKDIATKLLISKRIEFMKNLRK